MYVENNFIYCSHGPDGFAVYDCTDVNNIVFKKIIDSGGYNHSTWRHPFFPTYFYCAEETASFPMITYEVTSTGGVFEIIKKNEFKHPLIPTASPSNMYHNPHIKGNKLYISTYHDGIQIYDISDPAFPIREAYYDSYPSNTTYTPSFKGAWGVYPFFNSGCICVSDINTGFHTFKVNVPKVEFNNIHIAQAGKGIIFTDSLGGNKILTVSNLGAIEINPTTTSGTNYKVDSADVEIKNISNRIYLTSPNGSKFSISVSDLGSISASSATVPTSGVTSITTGNLYITNRYKGLIIKSPSGQRWKSLVKNSALSLNIRKTDF